MALMGPIDIFNFRKRKSYKTIASIGQNVRLCLNGIHQFATTINLYNILQINVKVVVFILHFMKATKMVRILIQTHWKMF